MTPGHAYSPCSSRNSMVPQASPPGHGPGAWLLLHAEAGSEDSYVALTSTPGPDIFAFAAREDLRRQPGTTFQVPPPFEGHCKAESTEDFRACHSF